MFRRTTKNGPTVRDVTLRHGSRLVHGHQRVTDENPGADVDVAGDDDQTSRFTVDSSHVTCQICTRDWHYCSVSTAALRSSECDLCQLVLKAISTRGSIPDRIEFYGRRDHGDIKTLEYSSSDGTVTLQIAPPSGISFAAGWSPVGYYETSDRAEAVIRFAREQLVACSFSHKKCHEAGKYSPDRLIEILPAQALEAETPSYHSLTAGAEAGDVNFRLVDNPLTFSAGSRPQPFACLSYCWGKKLPLRSTRQNFDELKQGIRWQTFPRTFQDAIAVTYCLGMRFIWIDALCIIQDDHFDWLRQAGRMGEIFGSADLTISAADASDCHSGFLGNQQAIWAAGPSIACADMHNKTQFDLSVRQWCGDVDWEVYNHASQYAPVNHTSLGEPMDTHAKARVFEPRILDTRGWAFQEACLSRRILSVASGEAGWECTTVHRCECRESLTADDTRRQTPKGIVGEIGRLPLRPSLHADHDLYLDPWIRLIQLYLRRDLSFPSDRLAAISGVARKFMPSGSARDEYLAGHWRSQLPLSLGWNVIALSEKSQNMDDYSNNYIAPSWSCASIPSSYQFGISSEISKEGLVAELLEAECRSSEPDGTGVVTGGFLRLLAPVTETSVELLLGAQTMMPFFRASKLEDFEPFQGTDSGQSLQARSINVRLWPDFALNAPNKPDLSQLSCIWLVAEQLPESYWHFSLIACKRNQDGNLRRVGLVEVKYRSWVVFDRAALLRTPLMTAGRQVVTIV